MSSLKIESFGGISNTNPPRSIRDNDLADAADVDINDAGNVLERLGASAAPILAAPISSAYNTIDGTVYLVSDGYLCRLNRDMTLFQFRPSKAIAFADKDDYLFTNDGLMVYGDTALSLEIPLAPEPALSIIAGNWPAGIYLVVVTYQNESGLMTGSSRPIRVDLPENSAIDVSTAFFEGFTAQVWMTEAYDDAKTGGEVFYNSVDGSVLPELFLGADKFPGGYLIEWFDSRLYLAQPINDNHTVLLFSHRHHYHLYSLSKNYVVVPDKVHYLRATESAIVMACENGIYAFDGINLMQLANYGCPQGRSIARLPEGNALLIHSKRGTCQYPDFKNLTYRKVSLAAGSHCSTHIVHQRGMRQFVALHNGGDPFNKHY